MISAILEMKCFLGVNRGLQTYHFYLMMQVFEFLFQELKQNALLHNTF